MGKYIILFCLIILKRHAYERRNCKRWKEIFLFETVQRSNESLGQNCCCCAGILIFEASEPMPKINCKLHLTDEGKWYDIDEATAIHGKSLKRLLKNAFNASGLNQISVFQSDLNDNNDLVFQSKQDQILKLHYHFYLLMNVYDLRFSKIPIEV